MLAPERCFADRAIGQVIAFRKWSYTPAMRFRCIVSYRSTRSKSISTWRTSIQGKDISSATMKLVEALKRRQRRPVTVVGMYLHAHDTSRTL